MPDHPIVIRACRVELDLKGESAPKIDCWYDRERTVNPELQKGLVCKPEVELTEENGKLIQRFGIICRPPVKILHERRYAPKPEVMRELKQHLRKEKHEEPSKTLTPQKYSIPA